MATTLGGVMLFPCSLLWIASYPSLQKTVDEYSRIRWSCSSGSMSYTFSLRGKFNEQTLQCSYLSDSVTMRQATSGFDLTNIFTQSFYTRRSQKCKKDSQVISDFFFFLHAKAAFKTFVKSTPDYNLLLNIKI